MTGEETAEQEELEAQFWTAAEGLQRTVMRLFRDSDIHPHVMVLALARVTGEVGAGAALAGRTRRSCWPTWPGPCARPGASSVTSYRPRPCPPRGAPEQDQW